ncbi:MAG: DUF434 domain-containing protein [Saprospiraceae bacterium]
MTTRNRGQHSNDIKSFAPKWFPVFTNAVDDFCFLLNRGYTPNAILQLVGNRYKLNKRQRNAILRISSSDAEVQRRKSNCITAKALKGKSISLDGLNILILLESALSGAYLFKGRDGTYRDISSVHGSYKRVTKTEEAIYLIGKIFKELEVGSVHWYLDQPVSNSGRLKKRLLEISAEEDYNWEATLVFDPDKVLAKSTEVVVTSDGWILDQVEEWFNLGEYAITHFFGEKVNLVEV